MPLPLLIIPIAAAAAGSVSTGTLIGSIVGALTGGAVLGGGGIYWYTSQKESESSDAHKASRNKQAKMTKDRIDATQKTVKSIHPKLTKVAQTVKEATDVTEKSVKDLKQATIELKEVSSELGDTAQLVKETEAHLATTSHTLKEATQELGTQTQKTCSKLEELIDLLKSKEDALRIAQEEMNVLKSTLDAQTTVGSKLEGIIKILTDEKAELVGIIAEQQKRIDTLEPQNKRLVEQMRFFKQVALKSSQIADTHQPEIASIN